MTGRSGGGWVCGVVFWIMALPAVPSFYGGKYLFGRLGVTAAFQPLSAATGAPERAPHRIGYLVMNVVAIAAGVPAGLYPFRAIAN